jgi:TonB family protein
MRITPRIIGIAVFLLSMALPATAQRPRTVQTPSENKGAAPLPSPAPAPQKVKAKYEGGVFGYNKKIEGTLSFDDESSRLVFRDAQGKEVLFIPYVAVYQEFSDTEARRPKSATILGSVPVPYGVNPIGYIKTKQQYVTIQFSDPDSHVGGITSFRVENKDICNSVVSALADKAGLVAQGQIFARPRPAAQTDPSRPGLVNRPAVYVEDEILSARVISLPRPVVPDEARQQKVAGVVRVMATIDEKGNVAEAEAISGSPMLQGAAVDAARQAKFEPVMKNGQPARSRTVISYNFSLL